MIKSLVNARTYYDSLVLMRLNSQITEQEEVQDAAVMMATDENKKFIEVAGLMNDEIKMATANDLVIVVSTEMSYQAEAAIDFALKYLKRTEQPSINKSTPAHTFEFALKKQPDTNLAILSIPGRYVKREAMKALEMGINLMIFSDNVPIEDEITIKKYAQGKGLLVMGPDCGTAIINGAALAFANAVKKGRIGLVGASGTGLQEVTCLIDHMGEGISHAIGTGTNDISDAVGGITMLEGIDWLENDPDTEVIVVVSKPPSPVVLQKVLNRLLKSAKPAVLNFLDVDWNDIESGSVLFARTLEEASVKAIEKATGKSQSEILEKLKAIQSKSILIAEIKKRLKKDQKYIRGVFSGGTFAGEATMLLCDHLENVYTNTKIRKAHFLDDPTQSKSHTCVDMGDDTFTRGKPHPMLEPWMRHDRILAEARDSETAVLLLDVLIGYGSHEDPAGELVKYLLNAQELAVENGRYLPIVASVCGVDADMQNRKKQSEKLEKIGVIVMPSNKQATMMAISIVEN